MKAGLIGKGIGASMTPAMHEAEGRTQGFAYRYDLIDTAKKPYCDMSLAEVVANAEAEGYTGLNITHPFKTRITGLVDELSDMARMIGAANTVIFRDGRKIGHNTDYAGFRSALEKYLKVTQIGTVLLVGAGGAGGAVALALIDQGVGKLLIYDKQPERAREMVQRTSAARPNASIIAARQITGNEDGIELGALDGVVNATPMGMEDFPGTAIEVTNLARKTWVADIVYFPLETMLLAKAQEHGCQVMNGSGMAIYQAAAAFELITARKADATRMAASFDRLYREKQRLQEVLTA